MSTTRSIQAVPMVNREKTRFNETLEKMFLIVLSLEVTDALQEPLFQ